jgi:hypothetical protein
VKDLKTWKKYSLTRLSANSTLPWWAFFLACGISAVALTFFAALSAMFGFTLEAQPLIQMIGAYLLPGRPLANMYFATFGWNSLYQANHMLKDLKLGQYVHLAPKCTFTMQLFGTVIGCMMSYITMQQITTEKKDVLLAIQGTNAWSGQSLQKHNSAVSTDRLNFSVNNANGSQGNHMGWPCSTAIWCRWQIPMGFLGFPHRSRRASAHIFLAQILPQTPSRLLEHCHHLRCNG